MSNQLNMAERENILALYKQGWSKRRISRELKLHRDTVRRCLKQAVQLGTCEEVALAQPSGDEPPIAAPDGATPPNSKQATFGKVATGFSTQPAAKQATPAEVATGSEAPATPAASRSKCEPFRSLIEAKITQGLTAQRIYQDLSQEHGFAGAYNAVKRMVRRLAAPSEPPFRRLEREPGAEAQADFGKGAPIIGADGKRRWSHVLRASLSFSRKGHSEAFFKQDTESWLAGWEDAFWAWGGVPKTLQTDNAKAAVKQADWYDPELHPIITAFCQHYGTVLLPIKARTPRHDGKIERGIGYVKGNGLKGRTFKTLAAENEHLAQWESQVADLRIHGTTKQQVRKLFELEKPALLPLPPTRFAFFHEGKRIVHRDGHIEVAKAYYSVPPEYAGHTVWARWDSHLVRILNTRFTELCLHPRREPGRFSTAPAHISSKKIALVESGAEALLRSARRIGPQAGRWAEAVLKDRSIAGVRVLVGLLKLARQHSALAVEQACALACAQGLYRLRELRALLKEPVAQEQFVFMAEHQIIRSLQDYGTLVKVHFDQPWEEPAGNESALN
jgi:transposase